MSNNIVRFEKDKSYNNLIVIGRYDDTVTVRRYLPNGKCNYFKCVAKVCEFEGRKMEGICVENRNYFADMDRNTLSRMKYNDAYDTFVEEKILKGEDIPKGFDLSDAHQAVKHAYRAERVLHSIC